MSEHGPLHLFQGYGIELEYMIVGRTSLDVNPVSDQVLQQVAGTIVNEVEVGALRWSNELVLHVLELKTNGPAIELGGVAGCFQEGIRHVNAGLVELNSQLLGTAMHPWMDPHRETRLWPHENSPIYAAYNRIFGCRGHGWSNLQSMHINLPFAGDEEFGRLHAAIRLILPLVPALAASSPVVAGRATGLLDNRLEFYRNNQKLIPEIAGHVIPEPVFTRTDYETRILAPTYRAVASHDPGKILQEEWLNSRGAIARFERNAIEIRLIDIQECPRADLAIAAFVVEVARKLCGEHWAPLTCQQAVAVEPLAELFLETLRSGVGAQIAHRGYLECFGIPTGRISVMDLWQELYNQLRDVVPVEYHSALQLMLGRGSLASRILGALPNDFTRRELARIYHELAECLQAGEMFHG